MTGQRSRAKTVHEQLQDAITDNRAIARFVLKHPGDFEADEIDVCRKLLELMDRTEKALQEVQP